MTEAVCAICGRPDGAGHEPKCYVTEAVVKKIVVPPAGSISVDAERKARYDRMPNVTFYDHGTSAMMGNYLTVCMKDTPEAYNEVHIKFVELFGMYPKSRSKFSSGEATFYSSDRGDRGATY
jgi:hypothetical protein